MPGSWDAAAAGVVGLAVKDAALLNRALNSSGELIEKHLTDDGLWEGSVHRDHFHNLAALVHFAEGCHRAGIDIYTYHFNGGKTLQTMFTAPLIICIRLCVCRRWVTVLLNRFFLWSSTKLPIGAGTTIPSFAWI